ncbi:RagB/SusD family nutrient uptake outer membrane protein [Flavivirga spongiicola]|uniref:RagB/SusD family nutrient uptake outer membrane protein n=1 Tax=Flavivirga spongiicola TaxID=421621 RepID=A0ABU7XQ29_9FLAO|nr:RagB/SusD family nutrient uptake outer membrane protein [Flavivirga sp. MEBiC05379]MDO5977877.1 RagB/SusD family nutrient uptake outer membrane protein [Flavivirga sp. MEBiC05379]
MKKLIFLFSFILVFTGCSNHLDQKNVQDLTQESFWQNADDARKGIIASYSALQAYNGSKWTFFEQMYIAVTWKADDILNAPTDYGKSIADFTNGTDDATFTSFWKSNYAGISYANQVIENVPNIPTTAMSDADKAAIIAEARFLRGLYHFHLVVAFENIPLITETPKSPDDFFVSQVSPDVVWTQIEEDFKAAKAALPNSWDNNNLGRATSHTATAYLGKLYLFQEKFTEAISEFNTVITSGAYDLLPNYADNFNGQGENGMESVFEIQWSADRSNGNDERHPFNFEVTPGALGGWELFYPSDWLFTEMQNDLTDTAEFSDRVYASIFFDDPLSEMSDRYEGVNKSYSEVKDDLSHPIYFKKYTADFDLSFYNGINIHLMRYADVLLMQAEALNEDNQTGLALDLVNEVRQRSKAAPLVGLSKDALRDQIRHHERPVELSMEYTIRWFDLYRWSKGSSAVPISETLEDHSKPFFNNFVDGKHDVFPIPLSDMNINENLVQNPGY